MRRVTAAAGRLPGARPRPDAASRSSRSELIGAQDCELTARIPARWQPGWRPCRCRRGTLRRPTGRGWPSATRVKCSRCCADPVVRWDVRGSGRTGAVQSSAPGRTVRAAGHAGPAAGRRGDRRPPAAQRRRCRDLRRPGLLLGGLVRRRAVTAQVDRAGDVDSDVSDVAQSAARRSVAQRTRRSAPAMQPRSAISRRRGDRRRSAERRSALRPTTATAAPRRASRTRCACAVGGRTRPSDGRPARAKTPRRSDWAIAAPASTAGVPCGFLVRPLVGAQRGSAHRRLSHSCCRA